MARKTALTAQAAATVTGLTQAEVAAPDYPAVKPAGRKEPKAKRREYPITAEAVEQYVEDNGTENKSDATIREMALAIINEDRENNDEEPLVRCPKDAFEAVKSYLAEIDLTGELEGDAEGSEDDTDGEDDEGEGEGRSVVKRKYKGRYRPFKMTNGDAIAQQVSDHVSYKDEDGKRRIDTDKLRAFAIANGCWVDTYSHLNAGMQRMNVANRLRARVRKEEDFEIVWA